MSLNPTATSAPQLRLLPNHLCVLVSAGFLPPRKQAHNNSHLGSTSFPLSLSLSLLHTLSLHPFIFTRGSVQHSFFLNPS